MESDKNERVEVFALKNVSISKINSAVRSDSNEPAFPSSEVLFDRLSNHVLENTINSLSKTEDQFDILRNDQKCLIDDVCAVRKELMQETMIKEIEHAIKQLNSYRWKMVQIKKTMCSIQESAVRLKKEAKRLEVEKNKEILRKNEYLKKSAEQDQQVMAKFSSNK